MAAENSSATAAAASIRAHLARSASGVDAQPSPRSLLSRILLRGGGGDGGSGGGGGFGCRGAAAPAIRRGGLKEERKEGSEQGETPRVKGKKKPEEELVSMNLGLGASLVLLLSKSAVELNKMVELRAQMEALLPLLKVKTKATDNTSSRRRVVDRGDANKEDGEVVNGNNADEEEVDDDEEEYEEAEEEEEEDEEEEERYDEDGMSPPHGGVSARALERRLHELLQKRQQERIVELESALDTAQRRLHEKEREVVWWRDAAKLVTHRRDEQQSRRFVR
ncbi:hypothetical protein HU200_003977 [Digitaria exilis]|uniref:Uncharacterized protein n=1 Tax=Digitaria exilis TaxID=1010633 RepID=A0A835FT32_9POAL|nr:hypothetical protein HU200_003977 [Digitaria exilis]